MANLHTTACLSLPLHIALAQDTSSLSTGQSGLGVSKVRPLMTIGVRSTILIEREWRASLCQSVIQSQNLGLLLKARKDGHLVLPKAGILLHGRIFQVLNSGTYTNSYQHNISI